MTPQNLVIKNLRANVTKNQVKFEFRGRRQKTVFSLFSSINSHKEDMKRDVLFVSSKRFKFEEIEESDFRFDSHQNGAQVKF